MAGWIAHHRRGGLALLECCSPCVGTYRLHAHDRLLHLGDVCDMVLIGLELLLLDPLIDANHQLSGDVRAVIHTYQRGGVRASDKRDKISLHIEVRGSTL